MKIAGRPIRVGVIGAGRTSQLIHLPILARLRDARAIELVAVCDLDDRRAVSAQEKFGFAARMGDAVALAERTDVDAVYVLGTARMHYEQGLCALQNGKHLFVEKPIAPSFEEACALASAARAAGLIAAGGHNRRFYKSLTVLRARSGKSGWSFAEAIFHKPEFGKPPPFGARTWLTANGIHALDTLLFMMGGLPSHVFALTDGEAVPRAFSAVMQWRGGAQGAFLCDNGAGFRREEYVFHAPGETWRVDKDGLSIHGRAGVSNLSYPMAGDGFAAEHEAFLDAIRTGEAPLHAVESLAPSLYLAERIEEGFSGALDVPTPRTLKRSRPAAGAILVCGVDSIEAPLARLIPRYRTVSLEDVRESGAPRPEVCAAILGRAAPPIPAAILDKLPNLGIVGVVGLSLARYQPDAFLDRGIALVNASTAYAETVADFAFALAVLGLRRAFPAHEAMRRGGWGTNASPPGIKGLVHQSARRLRPALEALALETLVRPVWARAKPLVEAAGGGMPHDLGGACTGLIGWGANASAFSERLLKAGARVLVYSEHANEEDLGDARLAPLSDVLAGDIVSLHRGLTPATRHFLGAAELARLKPGAVLINIARGALIEPEALLGRLKAGDVFACLDTFEDEPLTARHPLRRLPNVFLTPHIAGGSPEMHAAAAEEVVAKIAAWLDGETSTALAPERLVTMT